MNKWLLDTNVLIWFFDGSFRIDPARKLFSLPDTQVFISSVSWWEIAIKVRAGKLNTSIFLLKSMVQEYNFFELPLSSDCITKYYELPHIHKDPFDHMLLAQAITYPLRFITGDSILAEYSSLVTVI
ncbi:MAG: type II toxin-antitoxin system VapC family toxin [Treponema sp.]|jgi:PIN domain nuclease of toxin-antitoxin system|nr:type II toxin-antitoxin system VapC family toxin [Treponema sp.]